MSLEHSMIYLLKQQRKNGIRANNVHHGAKHADYEHIYSANSLQRHETAVKNFAKWAKNNEIRRLKDVSHQTIGDYCQYLQGKGYSAWTIKSGITAINHVMVQAHQWDSQSVFTAKKWNDTHDFREQLKRKNRGEIWNNRRQTAEEWRSKNATLYSNNRRLIDTARAFGLRRSELCHVDKNKPSIMENSFFEYKDRVYCFVPYGKGGRPRFATCRKDLEPEMRKMYQIAPVRHMPVTMTDTKRFRDVFVKKNEEAYRHNNYLYSGKVSGRLRFHLQRREYARERLRELDKEYPQYNYTTKTINGVTASERAFRALASDLGHGRIDVIGNYVEEGDL